MKLEVDASVPLFLLWCFNWKEKKRGKTQNKQRDFTALSVYIMSRDYSFVYRSSFFLSPFHQLTATGSSCHMYSFIFRWGKLSHKTVIWDWRAVALTPLYISCVISLIFLYSLNTQGLSVFSITPYTLDKITGCAWFESSVCCWSRVQGDLWHNAYYLEYWIT